MSTPMTIFVDLDGCVFQHHGNGAVKQWSKKPTLLPNVQLTWNHWEKDSHCIIIITSRRESCRKQLTKWLSEYGLFFDHLIMGVPHGARILINDKKADGSDSAFTRNLERNAGL